MTEEKKPNVIKTYTKGILVGFAAILFLGYWSITCIFNFPESSIVIAENFQEHKQFMSVLYQKWNFFAPPPTYNLRMHYIFTSKDDFHDVEVFENLNEKVKDKYLANDMYTNISWMLFSNADAILHHMGKYQKILTAKENCQSDSACTEKIYHKARKMAEGLPNTYVIINHAKNIANKLKLNPEYNLQIIISTIDIPKYADRYKPDNKQENIMFASSIFNPKKNQWIK